MKNNSVNRGDIFYYDFGETKGSIQSGVRPVLVIQCDEGNASSPTTIVASITSAIKKTYLPTHIIIGPDFGLKQCSMVLLEQISTVNQCDLQQYVGHIDDSYTLSLISNALKKGLGMWNFNPRKGDDVRCLCGRCYDNYKYGGNYKVKRLNPYNKIKDTCDICGSAGFDYVISERKVIDCNKKVLANG